MKVLVVGSGGREHAILWKLKQSPKIDQLYCSPGNAGTALVAENVHSGVDYVQDLLSFAVENGIDYTIIGPEVALGDGIADEFNRTGKKVFGPSKAGAQLETSKLFAKNFMKKYNIPTGRFEDFTDVRAAKEYIDAAPFEVVVKADGLAAGKGVIVPSTRQEAKDAVEKILVQREFGAAGDHVVIEERLDGDEATLLCFCDGKAIKPMVPSQDHKRLLDNDEGPNTGGMGVYAPTPLITAEMMAEITTTILEPTLRGIQQEQLDYRGILYVGLMIVKGKPFVLEYNCRFGDPEAQVVLPLLENDLLDVVVAVCDQKLSEIDVRTSSKHACCVILASGGYPGHYHRGYEISGLNNVEGALVFHAGTQGIDHEILTAGGRVLGVTALGNTLPEAIDKAYAEVKKIHFVDMTFRTDIGKKAERYK